MKILISFFTFLAVLMCSNTGHAHALWIESSSYGTLNQAHEVKVYYGEFATNERDQVDKWYSDVKDFSLMLHAPGNEPVKLQLTNKGDHFSGSFQPIAAGTYFLSIVKAPKDLGGKTKYEFSSLVPVVVGKSATLDYKDVKNPLQIELLGAANAKKGQSVQAKITSFGKVVPQAKVSVFSATGWGKEFVADENGILTFDAIWSGPYVLEASTFAEKAGEHEGKPYASAWQGSTTFVTIK
ncbi:MAG: DUF4198 domain-containing protein [Sphingobacterium sp.]|jgi:uncharacterized GH25 family protein|uniref:DUF4198 domain-containing protein n=1 Tax=Sphingobacterium sp. TaxID=341027 RepID=UPI002848D20D|nr:DUF4198 domain-containing protein [Sphingobacterium sp.]MDR3009881.1 DUF4198 domain-containing protein [Sphingobacterium sp.]